MKFSENCINTYITEKRYSKRTESMFLNACARIYNTKVVIHDLGIDVVHLFKNADHFNLMEFTG